MLTLVHSAEWIVLLLLYSVLADVAMLILGSLGSVCAE